MFILILRFQDPAGLLHGGKNEISASAGVSYIVDTMGYYDLYWLNTQKSLYFGLKNKAYGF